jgi:hypothetical protein
MLDREDLVTEAVIADSTACNSASGTSARVQPRASARLTISPVM